MPARQRARAVPRDLDAVCGAALEFDPDRRYRSAAELADDLDRVLRHEPPLLPQTSKWGRARRWMLRHPLISVGVTGTVLLLAGVALCALWLLKEQQTQLLRNAQWINAFAAHAQAGAILNELREHAERVQRAAYYVSEGTRPIGDCSRPAEELASFLRGSTA